MGKIGKPKQPPPPITRRVWRILTVNPQIKLNELVQTTGASRAVVYTAIRHLTRLGYVQRDAKGARAIRVIVPFLGPP